MADKDIKTFKEQLESKICHDYMYVNQHGSIYLECNLSIHTDRQKEIALQIAELITESEEIYNG